MKIDRFFLIFTGIVCIIVSVVLYNSLVQKNTVNASQFFEKISAKEVAEALDERKEMIVYCGQDTCSACRTFTPILQMVGKELGKEIFYLDVDLIDSQRELEKYQIQETPTLIKINKNDIYFYRGTMNEFETKKALSDERVEKIKLNGIEKIETEELSVLEQEPKDFILYIGRDDCGDCKKFTPILEEYLEKESEGVYYLSIKEYREKALREDATEEDIERYEKIKEKYEIDWVPVLIHFRNGIQVSRFEYLDKKYHEVNDNEKNKYEQEHILKFYEWIDREYQF